MNISFVIPVLNGDKFIRKCLDSIVSEADDADEIIVVDNGSVDATIDIVKSYNDVTLLVEPGITVAAMRNKGVGISCAQLLAFIDADCVLCEGWRRQVNEVFTDEAVDASGSLYDIPENPGWIEKAWFSQKATEKSRARYINSGNLVVKKSVFSELNGFDEALVSDEDCDFGERLNKAGYFMLEDPDIRVVHLGNPKSLKDFYLKEAWHATSVLTLNSSEIFNRPTIMTILFGLTVLVSFVAIVGAVFLSIDFLPVALLVLMAPLITAIYRAHQFKKYRYIPELTLLWGIFYLVRLNNMMRHIFLTRP